jgi:hypothetical protein
MKRQGLVIKILAFTGALVFPLNYILGQTQTFTTNGTFTVPAGVTSIIVECWGGGGAGGGTTTDTRYGGGGGAGGAYARRTLSVSPGNTFTVTVGGTAAGATTAGINGNPSWFGTTGTVYAQGGAGGAAPNNTTVAGGTGSSASSIGDVVFAGGNGADGNTTRSGGGGGGAGSSGIGGNASGTTGGTGTTVDGGSGGGGFTTENNGAAGSVYGGGGSGAFVPDATNHTGGSGAAGLVRVSWSSVSIPFYSSGSYTVPAGVTSMVVECWGGGGGGSNRTTNGTFTGGGGGGGAYASSIIDVIPGNTYNYVIGAGGAGSTDGGNSSFNSTSVVAVGGTGGILNSTAGGAGGSASSSTGNLKYSGGTGSTGAASSGGGGGGAGINGNGGNASGATGGTGTTDLGGTGGNGVSGSSNGVAGGVYGGGGSGASTNSTTNTDGGSGSNGLVVVSLPFFSFGNNDPSNLNSWWSNTNGTGFHPASFTANNQIYIIQNGNNYTTTSVWTVSGRNSMVKIENGGVLQANQSISFSANTIFRIENGGSYNHNHNINNNIFSGTNSFATGSTVNYMMGGDQVVAPIDYSNLTLSGSGAKTLTGVTINGRLSIEGTAITTGTSPAYGADASIIYHGSSSQTTGIELPATFSGTGGVTINNTSGVSLSGNVSISSTFTMTIGNVNTGSFSLSLTNNAAGSLIYTSGTIIGKFQRGVSTTLSTDYLFPVGTVGFYRPAVINFSSISAVTNFTGEFVASSPTGFVGYNDASSALDAAFTEGYWRFSSSSLPTVSYTITLSGNGFSSYTIDDLTRITGRDNSNSTWRALGVHGSRTGNDLSRVSVTNLNTTSFDFALARGCNIISMGYSYERNITIDYTKVSGGSDLFSFPVLVSFSGQNFLKTSPAGQITSSNGYDIIFTDNNYNKLDHQLEYFNGTNGDLIAWVRIPVLSCSVNTIIKILYGNSQVSTDLSTTSVWDSQYKGVWHLDNSNLNDFTSYAKSGTPYNTPTYPAGQISTSLGLNGTNQYVEVINDPNINFNGNITVSAWVYMAAGGRDQKIAGNQNNSSGGYKFGIYTNNKVEFEIRNSSNVASLNRSEPGGTVLSTGQWYYLAGVSSDVLDSIMTFVNGIPERPFKKTGILGTASNTLTIGKEPFQSLYYFSGRFDELRISDKVRSKGWMRTEYNNQSSPSTFYSVSSEAISYNVLSASICDGPITLTFGYPAGGTYSGNPYISGNVFTPPSAGTYPITYTIVGACGSKNVTKDIVITPVPAAPVAPNKEYCTGQIANLEVTTGVNIKWYNSVGNLVSTANPYSTGITTPGTYDFTVTQTVNGCPSPATSVTLTILAGTTIITHPQPFSTCAGSNATFSVVASGLNLTYQWQENGSNITNGGIYSGATTATLTLTNPGTGKNGASYRCVISSPCGTSPVNSNSAILTVNPVPVASFSYTGTPYCPNAANPSPTFSGGGVAGTFSSTTGLVFVSTATGQINIAASTPGSYTVTNTIAASGGCSAVVATSPFEITTNLLWTGASNTDWNNTGNWSCNYIPTAIMNVQIPNVANKPVLSSGSTGRVRNLIIEVGSSLTISGNTIQVSGTITNNGTLTATTGTVELNGTSAQVIDANLFSGNTINNLIINNNAGVTLLGALNTTGSLLVSNGTLVSNGNLTLVSSALQTALVDGSGTGQITGNVTMQRYLPANFGYKYLSSPFQSATVSELGDDMNLGAAFPSVYRYDESRLTSGWVSYINPVNILNPMQGYSVNFYSSPVVPNTVDITGIVNDGTLSVTLYNNNRTYTKGFNLVGNPYPSPINWNAAGWTKTNIDDALYFFKASGTDQYGGSYSTYVNGISSDGVANAIIPSMQGFFVHVSTGTYPVTGTLGFSNNVRVTNLAPPFFKSAKASSVPLVRITATFSDDPLSSDPAVIYFDENGTDEMDHKLDALKLFNTDLTIPNLYTVTSTNDKLSISALPPITGSSYQVPLGIKANRTGTINIKLKDAEEGLAAGGIFLTDVVAGIQQDLLGGNQYSVYLPAGEYLNRFFLKFGSVTTSVPAEQRDEKMFKVFNSNGVLKVVVTRLPGGKGDMTVFNILGQQVFSSKIYETGSYDYSPGVNEGIYIVTFVSGKERISQKLYIGAK